MALHIHSSGDIMKRAGKFIIDMLLLTAASLIMRGAAVAFGSWLSDRIGASGIGLYQLIMSVYIFAVTAASSGIRLASTRMVVECGEGRDRYVMRRCFGYALFFGCMAAALLFGFSGIAARELLGDMRTALSLKILALGLPFLSMSSAVNGYFSAKRMALRSSVVLMIEQGARMAISFILLHFMLPMGLEYACAALVAGSCGGEVISFLLLYIMYRRKSRGETEKSRGAMKKLVSIALPDGVSACFRSALSTAEQLMVPAALGKAAGSREAGLSAYGMISGMAMPVIFFPSALLDAMGRLLVPEMAWEASAGRRGVLRYITSRTIKLTGIFAACASVMLFIHGPELGVLLYNDIQAGRYIRFLAPLALFFYLDGAVDSMLKGLGQQLYSMGVNIADSALTVLLVWQLLPVGGTAAYIAIIYITELFNFVFSVIRLKKLTGIPFAAFFRTMYPVLCALGAAAAAGVLFRFGPLWLRLGWGCVFFVFIASVFGCISVSDRRWLRQIFSNH